MAASQPRVQAPGTVTRGDIFEVRTVISHPMETGLRSDDAGEKIARKLLFRFSCHYNDAVVFSVDQHEAVAENPYLSFYVRGSESGMLRVRWEEDGGAVVELAKPIVVIG